MKKILLFLSLFPVLAWGQTVINLDKTYIDSSWVTVTADTVIVNVLIRPDALQGADIGSVSFRFNKAYVDSLLADMVITEKVNADDSANAADADGTRYFDFAVDGTVDPAASAEVNSGYFAYNKTAGSNGTYTINALEGVARSYYADQAGTFRGVYGRVYINADATSTMRTGVGGEFSARAGYLGGTECVAESGTAFIGARIWMAPYFTAASLGNISNFHGLWLHNESPSRAVNNAIYINDVSGGSAGWNYGLNMSDAIINTAEIIGQNGEIIKNTTDGTWDLGTANLISDGKLVFDSTGSFGSWGYTGEHIALPESSSNTNAGLGLYSMVDYSATAGKVFAGTYSRILAMTTSQTNLSTMVGTESQFRLRDVNIANGVHAGLWAYAEQSGTSVLSGGGTFDAISATVESEAGFSAGATEHITGITIDGSIHASATINASANYSGIYIKSNGKDWFDGIKITGATNDIKLKNGATINNIRAGNLTITEDTVEVAGVFKATSILGVVSDSTFVTVTGDTVRANTVVVPNASQGADLGISGTEFNLVYADSIHANWFGGSDFKLGSANDKLIFNGDSIVASSAKLIVDDLIAGNLTVDDSVILETIVSLQSDTMPQFTFNVGYGLNDDTAKFSTSGIYFCDNSFTKGSDSITITELRAVMIAGETPLGNDTLAIQVYWNDSINVTGAGATKLNTADLGINSITTGTVDVAFDNATIPPNVYVFLKIPGVVTGRKPEGLTVVLSGYERNLSY